MSKEPEPKSELARYAFGYSDEKPGVSFWVIMGGMLVYVIYRFATL